MGGDRFRRAAANRTPSPTIPALSSSPAAKYRPSHSRNACSAPKSTSPRSAFTRTELLTTAHVVHAGQPVRQIKIFACYGYQPPQL